MRRPKARELTITTTNILSLGLSIPESDQRWSLIAIAGMMAVELWRVVQTAHPGVWLNAGDWKRSSAHRRDDFMYSYCIVSNQCHGFFSGYATGISGPTIVSTSESSTVELIIYEDVYYSWLDYIQQY